MAINLDDIINGSVIDGEWNGTGVFDKLLVAVNKNIEMQHEAGRITGSEFANAYSNSIQSVLAQSIEYALRKDLIESQLLTEEKQREVLIKDIELKEEQVALTYAEHILKDKEAALVGLDNVVKNKEVLRASTPNYVYTPSYIKQ